MIQRESLVDISIKRIKQHIIDHNYIPGDKYLSEKELINRLQVSRTVVREALISLQSIGLIKIVSGDGIYIANAMNGPIKEILKHHNDVHGIKIRELIEIRKVIELGAIRLIIEKDLIIDYSELARLNDQYYQAIINEEDTRPSDQQFHQLLIQSTQNHTFYHFSQIIQEYFTLTKMDIVQTKEALLATYDEHHAIIQAMKQKNMEKAQGLMIEHLEPILLFINQLDSDENN